MQVQRECNANNSSFIQFRIHIIYWEPNVFKWDTIENKLKSVLEIVGGSHVLKVCIKVCIAFYPNASHKTHNGMWALLKLWSYRSANSEEPSLSIDFLALGQPPRFN